MQNPEEVIDLILNEYGSRLTREELRFEAQTMQELILPELVELGHMNPGRWQHIADTYSSLGLLPKDFPLEGFLYRPEEGRVFNHRVLGWLVAALVLFAASILILLLFNQRLRTSVQKRTEALKNSEMKLRQLADSMPQLVWSADQTGAVDYYNERHLEFIGFSQNQNSSWNWIPVLHPDDREKTLAAWEAAIRTGSTYQIEHRIQRNDGSFYWFLSRATPIRNQEGQVTRWFGTTTDIDDLKRTEIALDDAKEAAEQANLIKGEFLAKMSHEIRTPITVFSGAIEYLLEIDQDPTHRKVLDLAELSSRRLHILVDEILDFSKIEAHKMVLDEDTFELRKCLRETLKMMESNAQDKALHLELSVAPDVPAKILGDGYRLGQILLNLVGNAIKFTEKGDVKVSVARQNHDLVFAVSDTGIGMDVDRMEHLFEAFTQVDSSATRRHGGAGLGLAIVKGLVELMGGQISVQSQPGHGSTFSFTLPMKAVNGHDA